MAGRSKHLIRFGVVATMLAGVSIAQGEIFLDGQQAFGWRCGVGMPFMPQRPVANTQETQDGFSVIAGGTAIQETAAGKAIELIAAGEWVKAIQTIESLSEDDHSLVLDEAGVLRPLSSLKSALIASMPEEGRRTFCRLNDPAANTKLQEAQRLIKLQDKAQAYAALVNDYALCDAAAAAAETLGDIRFEQGRFDEAAELYRFASDHPAAASDDPMLTARRLIALSRAKQWKSFDTLAEYTRFRHPETAVELGAQSTKLVELISQLAVQRTETPSHQPSHHDGTLALPKDAEPEFDRPLVDKTTMKMMRQFAINNNMAGVFEQLTAPVVAADAEGLYTLAFGSLARLDPVTGSDLWRVGDQNAATQRLQQRMYELNTGYHQSLTIHEDTLLAVVPHQQRVSSSNLHAHDVKTGEQRWDWHTATGTSNRESVVGEPLVIDDKIYFMSYRSSMELVLNIVNASDGSKVKNVVLGKASKGANMQSPGELSPRLTMGQGHLLVQTNNGALIAVDPIDSKVAWAFSQKIRPSGLQMLRTHGQFAPGSVAWHTGEVVARDGLVIAKDTRNKTVVAFREHDAARVWIAEAGADATIVHTDKQHVYVLGEELVALDIRTGERVWWTPHPGDASGQPIFTEDACLIAGNERLCRIDLTTGKLTNYREDITDRADLMVIDRQIVHVTKDRISGFRLP